MTKRRTILAAAALLLACSAAAAETTMSGIFPYPIHVDRLDNGLQVVTVPMSSGGLAAFWTVVRTGARDEVEPGHTGFAHFFEHMMFRGTRNISQEEYRRRVTALGANANAFTSDDLTAYHLAIAAEDLEEVMRIESDRFKNLDYPVENFKTEAGAVYGEYRKNRTSPFFAIYEAMRAAAFTTHTYGHTAMGYEEDIKRMPEMYDYSRSFLRRFYRPENCILLVVGDVTREKVVSLARTYYADWAPGYEAPKVPVEPEQTQERRIDVPYEGRSLPILGVGYKVPAFDPSNRLRVAADVLSELVFGETSPLYQKLVIDEQSVEFLSASIGTNRDPGLLTIQTRVKDPGKVDAILGEIDAAIAGAQSAPPDPQRLADLKSRIRYGFLMNLESPGAVAGGMARILAVTADPGSVDRLFAAYAAVTPADVQAAARTLISARRTVAVLRGTK